MAATSIDTSSLASMSFVPTDNELVSLYKQSKNASESITDSERGPLLSKLYKVPAKIGLCPESLNPEDTILVDLAKKNGVVDSSESGMTFISDRNMPFGGGSNGPNGIVIDCNNKYGKNRINFIGSTENETHILVQDYLNFRNQNLQQLFELYVSSLNNPTFTEHFKLDPSKDVTLDENLRNDYLKVSLLFSHVANWLSVHSSSDLEECGIRVKSFCQTWLRNTNNVGDAQFSVMSPHSQTRFYIYDDDKLKMCGVSEEQIEAYTRLITHHNKTMASEYGVDGGGQAFIDLDALCLKLSQ